MMKKMIVVAAVLMMVVPAFGWTRVVAPADQNKTDYTVGDMVDWEKDGNNTYRKGEVWNWPAEYLFLPICEVPVKMEVGFWIKVVGCTVPITVKQVEINKYVGSKTATVYANVSTDWKAAYVSTYPNFKGSGSATVSPSHIDVDPANPGKATTLTITATVNPTDLTVLPAPSGDCVTVGKVILSVRPAVMPNYFMADGCQGDTFPTWPGSN